MGTLGRAAYTVGFWIRETGQAMDRLGSRLQGNNYFKEQLSRHRTLMNVYDKTPAVAKDAFVAPSASIIGDVQVGAGSSISDCWNNLANSKLDPTTDARAIYYKRGRREVRRVSSKTTDERIATKRGRRERRGNIAQ
ncbi:gamma carbonic anhydrase 1, mitochondrial [Tanacetum coccineum]|uniref:Gamma carbonic anhydrase 1, mitochondrial n=1 Tax=Tanacetum coccineum TaxID=301880 RepID=A0ABQ5CU75_9ASTR